MEEDPLIALVHVWNNAAFDHASSSSWHAHSPARATTSGARQAATEGDKENHRLADTDPKPDVEVEIGHIEAEILVISEQRNHQLHHSSGRRNKASSVSPHFSSPQSTRGYHAGNYRAFHSGISIGILPSPPAQGVARTRSSPEPKTPKQKLHHGKKRSRAISISPSTSPPSRPELWAGPGFCNSPPPSSLPIPKFSLHQNRSVPLEFPPADWSDDEEVPVHAKSAPSSPTAGSGSDATIATENLRRILHLKIEDN